MRQNILTSFRQQQRHQVRLFLGNNVDKLLKIGNTSPRQKFQQFVVAIIWCTKADDMFSLAPGETSGIRKLGDERIVRVDSIQKMDAIHCQYVYLCYVKRSNVSIALSNVCKLCKNYALSVSSAKDLAVWNIVYIARRTNSGASNAHPCHEVWETVTWCEIQWKNWTHYWLAFLF